MESFISKATSSSSGLLFFKIFKAEVKEDRLFSKASFCLRLFIVESVEKLFSVTKSFNLSNKRSTP